MTGALSSASRSAKRWIKRVSARPLTVQAYDDAERQALRHVPNRIVECCQPTTFLQTTYPTRIDSDDAVFRYVDVMHEGRTELTFDDLLGGIAPDEMEAMRVVAERVARMSERACGRRLVPRSSLLRALNVLRHIRYLFPTPALVLEIGGGSGYLGALLLQLGYRYITTDITQAFYLWQNHLLNAMAPGRVAELATQHGDPLVSLGDARAIHIPWWKFVVPSPDPGIRVDIVTCNHALCEMHPHALKYTLALAHALLEGEGPKAFLFEGWGSTIHTPIWHVGANLAHFGFMFAHNDVPSSVAIRNDSPYTVGGMRLPLAGDSDAARYHPNIHVTPENRLSDVIVQGRAATRTVARHGLADFDDMLRRVLGKADLRNDDDRFGEFVTYGRRG